MKPLVTIATIALLLLVLLTPHAHAQGTTAFTYQGQLKDNGTNAGGAYTMIFKLYDAVATGNQVGSTINSSATLANGLFTVNLDFGNVFNGAARWLDITITNGGVTQTLSPRVQVLPTPYAQFAAVAATVTNGAIQNAQLAASAVTAGNIASGQVVKSLNGLTDTVSLTAGANVTITPTGNTLTIASTGVGGGTVTNINIGVTNTLAAGNNVGLFTNNGVVQISSFIPNIQLFRKVTNAIFTVPTNVTRIMVEMWGSGGGGGGGHNDGINFYSGGGGGAGGYTFNVFTVTPGSNYLVTAGSGGVGGGADANGTTGAPSSFGSLLTANGGTGGLAATASNNGNGGTAGIGTGGLNGVTAGDNGGTGGGFSGGGGYGGGVWRGSPGSYPGGGNAISGPGGGGGGGGSSGGSGNGGNGGGVFVYY